MDGIELDRNVTRDDLLRMIKYTAAFTNPISAFNASELETLKKILEANRFTVELTMRKLMYPCSRILHRCRWEGVTMDCKQLFRTAETYQGYCCTFNAFKPVASTLVAPVIRKTHYFGPESGLSVVLSPKIELNAMTSVNSDGMKILINPYNLYPSERSIERMIPHQTETYVEIRPEQTVSTDDIRALPIHDRGCLFEDEFKLKHFPTYSNENCRVECNMEMHKKLCRCLPYFFYNTENAETCDFTSIDCMIQNRSKLRKLQIFVVSHSRFQLREYSNIDIIVFPQINYVT